MLKTMGNSYIAASIFFMKNYFLVIVLLALSLNGFAQKSKTVSAPEKPKLIVGIVIDQMAYEFLYRYQNLYSDDGFNKLVNNGYDCTNAHYNYIPTYTGPGHTCIYTGSVPAIHGIISNDWYNKNAKTTVYCTSDTSVSTVGGIGNAGKMSPHYMLTTTITDQLQLSNNGLSKVIGIALKDRGAILPAGHMADGAYWFDGANNGWITSSYYMNDVPQWVKNFNSKNLPALYLTQPWNLLYAENKYTTSTPDNEMWEGKNTNETAPVFPHSYTATNGNTEIIKATPWGNTLTEKFAEAAIVGENMGIDSVTDFLTVSFSSTDYIGHQYGPNSLETEDCYLRMDKDLASFIHFLDSAIGTSNYLLFLTADHGVAMSPAYANSLKLPGGVISGTAIKDSLNNVLSKNFGLGNWITAYENQQVYFNDSLIEIKKADVIQLKNTATKFLLNQNGVANVVDLSNIGEASISQFQKTILENSIYPIRSGSLQIILEPGWFEDRITGTTHGTFYSYDTHVPLLFYGWKIKTTKDYSQVDITDIAETLSLLLNITEPSGCIGKPISGLLNY